MRASPAERGFSCQRIANFVGPPFVANAARPTATLDHPLPTGHVMYEVPVVVTRQERHFEPSVRRVLGTDKEPNAESANRESPSRGVVAAPMADEPGEDEGNQPDATNPNKIMPPRRIYDFALGASWLESTNLFTKEMGPARGPNCGGPFPAQTRLGQRHDAITLANHPQREVNGGRV